MPEGETATVTDVIDGDTIDVSLNGREERIRYIGIDTPERGDYFYEEATEANADYVLGQTVILVKDVSETDRYGRLLRYVYLEDGTFVNAELVWEGYAHAYTFPPDVYYSDYFLELEQGARTDGRGLWDNSDSRGGGLRLTPVPQPTNLQPQATQEVKGGAAVCDCSGNQYNCADFATHDEAQACYNYCIPIAGDVHDLDRDGDGLGCESLP